MSSEHPKNHTTPTADPAPQGPSLAGQRLVRDLERGQRVDRVFLVENSNFKQTRNNKHFIQADVRDRSGSIKAIRWEATRDLFNSFRADDFVHVVGRVEEFQQRLQIIIDDLWKVDEAEIDIDLFLPTTDKDVDVLERDLRARVEAVEDHYLRELLRQFLTDDAIRGGLRRCPAGKALHHAWIGGLLEHIVSLCRAVDLLCQNYPRLDRDLLLTGAILHDIGKIRELAYDRVFKYTDVGQLVGHIAIGITWVTEKAARIPGFPPATLIQVQHLIASHHGEPEFGAVKTPMTQEALALHYLDNLDAKLSLFETVQREQGLGSQASADADNWSDWHPAMGRRLFFP